jgi:hypothetical protein
MSAKTASGKTRGATVIWLAIMAVFMAELLAYTWCRVQSIRLGYEISAATRQFQHQGEIRKNLTIALAHLKSPERIEALGHRLGLAPAATRQIVVME